MMDKCLNSSHSVNIGPTNGDSELNCSKICTWDLSVVSPPRSFADLFVDASQLTHVYIGDYLDWEIDWSTSA